MSQCLNCGKDDRQVPLLPVVFNGGQHYICPQCLPVLIHKPDKLADKLPGMQPGKLLEHD